MIKIYHALNIAQYVIARCNSKKKFISNLKLQKILYFIQAEFLVSKGKPCFHESIEAWDFGSVIPDVFYKYSVYGSGHIPYVKESKASYIISVKDKELLKGIIDECSMYSSTRLLGIIHNQTPWIEAYESGYHNEIRQESIKEFFEDDF